MLNDDHVTTQLFDHVRRTFHLTDGDSGDVEFRTVRIIFNDRMTPAENRPAIGFPRFGMFYRTICCGMFGTDGPSPLFPLPAVAYLSNEVPVFRTKRGTPCPQNLIMESVWMIPVDHRRDFDRSFFNTRRKMKGRYAIDTLCFGYPVTLDDLRNELRCSGEIAVKDFVGLDRGSEFVVYG
ncbi:hypothetical protein EV666_13514 [Camelimonas lactis]|uniref:Uncharacterized protein n=1 Tax=Camelimonas lactis TaxID=659006 RepID=A0A4R2GGW3_9HYPH|nr:hypothetical protein EV666_13514 [Camelimonas lactis]